jgi:zinc D-Ala-D-Ala carboxypeptidase
MKLNSRKKFRPKRHHYLAIALLILTAVLFLLVIREPEKANAPTPTSTSQHQPDQPEPEPSFDKSKYPLDNPESIWTIINKNRPLSPLTYAPSDLVSVGGGQQLRSEAASALTDMFEAAAAEGLYLESLSGYRSYNTQVSVYNREVATFGQIVADTQSAKPGFSEHQTGLAIDVGGGGCGIEDCFAETAEGKWVAANAHKYGFIIRYPEDKDSVTGYRYEPWHLRYVGVELATEMHNKNIQTLEEFFSL